MWTTELRTKWSDVSIVTAGRINPPVYSHPEMVHEIANDLLRCLDEIDEREPVQKVIVDTVAQLDELPVGTLIMEVDSEPEKYAFPWVKVATERKGPLWSAPGDAEDYPASEVGLPAYVMWTPPNE